MWVLQCYISYFLQGSYEPKIILQKLYYNTAHLLPEGTVTDTPALNVTGPVDIAEYPAGIEYDLDMVLLFTTKPLSAISCSANRSPVLGLYK
jgi:hypothetical protein